MLKRLCGLSPTPILISTLPPVRTPVSDLESMLTSITVLPPLVYGPYIFKQTWATSPDYHALSTNIFLYNFLEPNGVFPLHPRFIDVRDLAELHLRCLTAPADRKRKRLVIASPDVLDFNVCLDQVREQWPARVNRNEPPVFGDEIIKLVFDYELIEEVTGMKRSAFRGANEASYSGKENEPC